MKKIFRWKAILPLLLVLLLIALGWRLMLPGLIRRGLEAAGAAMTGARVEVERVQLSLTGGWIRIGGIQAADPDLPMTNQLEVGEVVADLRFWPLLQKKLVIDTLAVRGVRFGTPRSVSGQLPVKERKAAEPPRWLAEWSAGLPHPSFSLEGLTRTVDVGAIEADSLSTVRLARALPGRADSLWMSWQAQLRELDVQPQLEAGRALADRLKGASLRSLGVDGVTRAVRDARNLVRELDRKREGVGTLQSGVRTGMAGLEQDLGRFEELRARDLAWARGLLKIPSLEAPDIGPALFTDMARERLGPILKWLAVAERYLPPGLKQRPKPGPERARAPGLTVLFPRRESLPAFLLTYGEIELDLGDQARSDRYDLTLRGVTSDPAVYGRPTTAHLERARGAGGEGTDSFRADLQLDHRSEPVVDSLEVVVRGTRLVETSLGGLGGRLDLGSGDSSLRLVRRGPGLEARLFWRSDAVTWTSTADKQGVEAFVWATLSRLRSVEIDTRVSGTFARPHLAVRSNVADELSRGLRAQLGEEVRRAEQRVRDEVDRRIQPYINQARTRVDALRSEAEGRVGEL
jgi:uncharacterized protein (TIGR03545 family)